MWSPFFTTHLRIIHKNPAGVNKKHRIFWRKIVPEVRKTKNYSSTAVSFTSSLTSVFFAGVFFVFADAFFAFAGAFSSFTGSASSFTVSFLDAAFFFAGAFFAVAFYYITAS
ncbi:MAG: hypothetical protein IJD29_07900, partial [Anaerotignum sp.]|nr:hypothetical protein [Anaerotignum sp.]